MLCHFCKQINFSGILTPRHYVDEVGSQPIYRTELAGVGGAPVVTSSRGKSGPPEFHLPKIRTANYFDLSGSDESDKGAEDDKAEDKTSEDYHVEDDSSEEGNSEESDEEHGSIDHGSDTEEVTGLAGSRIDDGAAFQGDELKEALPEPGVEENAIRGSDEDGSNRHSRDGDGDDNCPAAGGEASNSMDAKNDNFDIKSYTTDESLHSDLLHIDDNHSDDDSASTWSDSSHFTQLIRIDTEKEAQGEVGYFPGLLYYLGTIWDVRSRRKTCDLCSFFWNKVRNHAPIFQGITKSRCILKCVEFKCKRPEKSESKDPFMLNLAAVFAYRKGDQRHSMWYCRFPFVLQGRRRHENIPPSVASLRKDDTYGFRDEMFGEARHRSEVCDFQLFKRWLALCESKHNHVPRVSRSALTVRLIDVEDQCIVDLQRIDPGHFRFVVLSYVWGVGAQKIMLTTENIRSLLKRNSLQDVELCQTVRDAMEVVAQLGERYLWVDALCILQDSKEDKEAQIPQMHLIYGQALLTIVAGSGDDAGAGLPGVRPFTRKATDFTLELDDMIISKRNHMIFRFNERGLAVRENYLLNCTYNSRAWTLQEAILSTRSLIFTTDQVFWECPWSTWCEETCWESQTLRYFGSRAINDPTPTEIWNDNFDRENYDMTFDGSRRDPKRHSYALLVKLYAERQLTYESDIPSGVTGIMRFVGEKEQTRILFALRERYFGNDLLWNWNVPCRPRHVCWADPKTDRGKRRLKYNPFPSWSWLGWHGRLDDQPIPIPEAHLGWKLDIPNEPRFNSYDYTEDMKYADGVRCYVLDIDSKGKRFVRVVNENGGWQFGRQNDPVGGPEGRPRPQEVTLAQLQRLPCFRLIQPNFHVCFWTYTCPVSLREVDLFIDDKTRDPGTKEAYYGQIVLDNDSVNMLMAYKEFIPNGNYECLHLNNDGAPEFGHMLVRWKEGIAERVCMARGPAMPPRQAEWKMIVLG
jgi:hypothetical protein